MQEDAVETKTLLDKLVGLLPEAHRAGMRGRILCEMEEQAAGDEARALRFLKDLDIFVHLRGPDFIYARGIAETLRVGEDIFELAYDMKKRLA
jgi:hypothetical protein